MKKRVLDLAGSVEQTLTDCLIRLVSLSGPTKFAIVLLLDASSCVLATIVGFSLRLGEWQLWNEGVQLVAFAALALWLPIFLLRGIYSSVVRYVGARTIVRLVTSCMLMSVGLASIFTLNSIPEVPRTIAVIQPMVFVAMLIFSRLAGRYVLFDVLNRKTMTGPKSRVLIYGAGTYGRQLALSLMHEPDLALFGYIDDDDRLTGKQLDGVSVFGSIEVEEIVTRHRIEKIFIAVPRIGKQGRERIVKRLAELKVHVQTLPAMSDLLDGSVSVSDLREIAVADLLGRDPVAPNQILLNRTIKGRTVMVTGAGGSIGSELCRQIAQLEPNHLVLVEMTEHALYEIEAELREQQASGTISGKIKITAELLNIVDLAATQRLFDRTVPDSVFHAAAYKHVPLVEDNVVSGVRNNVFGTLFTSLAAKSVGTQNFVLISTDKAVRPTNVMGASKRVCELILQAQAQDECPTIFANVRFGNVLGSSGSVVPRFETQIRNGGPVTLTHSDVTRYFMTIPEAAQLVIQAGAMAKGGEVFVLDMGEPVRIYDLAEKMIRLAGLTVLDKEREKGDIEIREIGLRKGEKLYEELLIGNSPQPTSHSRIMMAHETSLRWRELQTRLETLELALNDGDSLGVRKVLQVLVPEFQIEGEPALSQAL